MGSVDGIVAAVVIAGSDLCAARASRSMPPITVTRSAVLVSALIAPLFTIVIPTKWIAKDFWLSIGSGFTLIGGLVLLYKAFTVGKVGVVAAVTSVLAAAIAVVADFITGERLSVWAWFGVLFGLAGIALASYTKSAERGANDRLALVLMLTAGGLFGAAYIFMGSTTGDSGMLPVIVQRSFGTLWLVVLGLFRKEPLFGFSGNLRGYVILTGVLAAGAMCAFQYGLYHGPQGTVAVVMSQYSAVAVVYAWLLLKERVTRLQISGLAAGALGVVLMAM